MIHQDQSQGMIDFKFNFNSRIGESGQAGKVCDLPVKRVGDGREWEGDQLIVDEGLGLV